MRSLSANGDTIRQFRKSRGWTQEQLARECECSVRTVRNTERGERVDIATLARVADALGLVVADILPASSQSVSAAQTERHKQLVLDWEDAYMACDVDRILACHQPDTVLEMPGSESLPAGGTYQGIDQLRAHLEFAFEHIRVIEVHDRQMHAVDNIVFSRPLSTLLAVATGKKFTTRFLNEIEFRDNKICRRMTLTDWGLYRKHLGIADP